jgi:hypothetical protein
MYIYIYCVASPRARAGETLLSLARAFDEALGQYAEGLARHVSEAAGTAARPARAGGLTAVVAAAAGGGAAAVGGGGGGGGGGGRAMPAREELAAALVVRSIRGLLSVC